MNADGVFPVTDIEVIFQNYRQRPYPQLLCDDFVSNLSVLDALFYIGCESTSHLIKTGTQEWLSWEEMAFMESKERKDQPAGPVQERR